MIDNILMSETVNWKKLCILFFQKLWIMVGMIMAGALIGSSLYLLITVAFQGAPDYELKSGYYIEFAEGVLNAKDYYNAYTWNSAVHQDDIMNVIMEELKEKGYGDRSREEIEEYIKADILSDVRYLDITITSKEPELSMTISEGCIKALSLFGEKKNEFSSITKTYEKEPKEIIIPDFTWRAAVLGAIIGTVAAVAGFFFWYATNDVIYVPEDLKERGIQVISIFPQNIDNKQKSSFSALFCDRQLKELQSFLAYHTQKQSVAIITLDEYKCQKNDEKKNEFWNRYSEEWDIPMKYMENAHTLIEYEEIRKTEGAILVLPFARSNGALLMQRVRELEQQDCRILGVILVNAKEKFLKNYYGTK